MPDIVVIGQGGHHMVCFVTNCPQWKMLSGNSRKRNARFPEDEKSAEIALF
ncbi:hypothetical protein [Lelliottia sp. RWM.1]|uniref:hypothetical protein n=1 Tax=Lelliottia sp. RWM.1 TaxID=2663242 RepID=UPI00193E2E5E|nr:hypothetical protein [Lelliottia sp. RWM.1]MBM3074030.1 hypothetical protein [Lelliottia sp. RWM.1]